MVGEKLRRNHTPPPSCIDDLRVGNFDFGKRREVNIHV